MLKNGSKTEIPCSAKNGSTGIFQIFMHGHEACDQAYPGILFLSLLCYHYNK